MTNAAGDPGTGNDGTDPNDNDVGSDVDTYIDVSDNGGNGYPPHKPGVPAPLWIILAHELTTGHASNFSSGIGSSKVVGGENVYDRDGEEAAAGQSENPHRAAHGPGLGQR